MSTNDVQANIQTVLDFVDTAFKQRRPKEAFDQYTDGRYIQHDPTVPDGQAGFLQHAEDTIGSHPNWDFDVKRVIAQDDHVVVHFATTLSGEGDEFATIDIWRLEDGKIAEHWGVLQPIPDSPANDSRSADVREAPEIAANTALG